jgi:hypothetical protein
MQKIQEILASGDNAERIDVDGVLIPTSTLKKLLDEGFTNIQTDRRLRSLLIWSSNRASHLTEEQLLERYSD